MSGIILLDGPGKPPQAFVVAHQGNVGRHDRGHRFRFSLNDWHRITSIKPGEAKARAGLSRFRGFPMTPGDGGPAPKGSRSFPWRGRKRRQSLATQALAVPA